MATTQTRKDAPKTAPPAPIGSGEEKVTPPLKGAWWKMATGLIMAYVCFGAFYIAKGNVNFAAAGNVARIVFFHVPCAILSYVSYVVGFCYALRYLAKQTRNDALDLDSKSSIGMELGFVFCILATITGSIFAGMVWGSYWNWDPRETSIVVMLLLYASYLVLRGALAGRPVVRARLSAVYALIAIVPATYLIWVVPRIMSTNHPTNTLQDPANTSLAYKLVLYPAFIAFTMLFVWLFQLRFRLYKVVTKRQNREAS